jgi:dihydrofolate reductase
MTRVRADLMISLDGVAATDDATPESPFGEDWARLTEHYVATRSFRERVFGDTSGDGTMGLDDDFHQSYFEGVGAEIMGAGKFGLHAYPDDPDWRGWWGETPPFHYPVFVLTHRELPSIEMQGGTTFHFLSATPTEALAIATEAADGADVRIGGGPTSLLPYLTAGLVDELHVAITPIVLGRGIRLWDALRAFERDYEVTSAVAPSGVIHVTFARETRHP